MKKIDDLQVKVTYRVGLGGLEVPNKVHDELKKAADDGVEIDVMTTMTPGFENAAEWLRNHIAEADCTDCIHDIEDIS